MISKIKEKTGLFAFVVLLLGGLIAPFFTPNYGVVITEETFYMPVPYL